MEHSVLDCAFPQNAVQNVDAIRLQMPTIGQLSQLDAVLVGYHEYVQPWLAAVYGYEEWKKLMNRVPVIARFDESMDRADLGLPMRVPELLKWAHHYSWPAAQDAEKYGGEWLPYGADIRIFHPGPNHKKKCDIAFIGTLYKKRQDYLNKLTPHIRVAPVHVATIGVHDLFGIKERESTDLLAENYRYMKIFFLLPPASNLIVEKAFDIMASDTLLFYPRLFENSSEKNLAIFEDKKHLVYYDVGFFADNGEQIRYYLAHDSERERIAKAGGELVRTKYTLEIMMKKMLANVSTKPEVVHDVSR